MDRPIWLDEEAWLLELLRWFVSRLDEPRVRDVTRRIGPATVRALYRFDEDTRYRWQLVETLARDYELFTIRFDPRIDRHQERYHNAQLRLNPEAEPILRAWLNQPQIDPVKQAWQRAIARHRQMFSDGGAALATNPPSVPGVSLEEQVAAFARVAPLLDGQLSLREISAHCFHGDSKFLDSRRDLLARLFGQRVETILPRPLLLTAWAPSCFTRLLIVENQDNFLRLANDPPENCALIYSGGFRASAARLRSPHTRFAYLPGSDSDFFQAQWHSKHLPSFFWGDLDFAGMGILASLRHSLPRLQAWQPGYQTMLAQLLAGDGHSAERSGKKGQADPGATGCAYADTVLLPALRHTARFMDQEAVDPVGLERGQRQ